MEERIELKDPDHPEAKEAAEATARLLVDVHRKKQEQSQTAGIPASGPGCENEADFGVGVGTAGLVRGQSCPDVIRITG
jgi:hypothetical protein